MTPVDDALLFSKLVKLKSFTAVADALQTSRSLVSKRIARLEDRLGVQLVNRTTRRLEITEAGRTFYQYCLQIENAVQEAEAAVSEIRRRPKGNLRINAPVTFGQMILPPIITRFLEAYPDVNLSLSLNDHFVDVIEGGYDLVIRIGRLQDSSLKARRIGTTKLCVFAHRDYLSKHGTPRTPKDLQHHNCLIYSHMRPGPNEWKFTGPSGAESVAVSGNFSAENGVPLYKAVQLGLGIAIQPDFVLQTFDDKDIVCILEEYAPQENGIYAVYPATAKPPLNTRVFIDFMVEYMAANTQDRDKDTASAAN